MLAIIKRKRRGLAPPLPSSAAHDSAGDVPLLVDEVEHSRLLPDADLRHNLDLALASLLSAGHLGAGDIATLVDEIQVSLLLLYPNLRDFLCHWFFPLL